jgi:hypothetical protein
LRVHVRLRPGSRREGVDGIETTAEGAALKVLVRAAPEKGAANAALARTVAEWLGIAKSSVEVVAGARSRLKTIFITGERTELVSLIAARVGPRH